MTSFRSIFEHMPYLGQFKAHRVEIFGACR